MAVESVYFTESDDGSPLSEGELMVKYFLVLKPQHPQEERRLYVFRERRRLLASEESSKTFVPHLLSNTNIPHLFRDCPRFIEAISYSVGSLPGDTNRLNVYNVVLDVAETVPESLWVFNFMREKASTNTKEEVKIEVEDPSDCAICLQELQVAGTEATTILPCSHVFHPSCVLSWFLRSDNCPLCRSRLYVAITSFDR